MVFVKTLPVKKQDYAKNKLFYALSEKPKFKFWLFCWFKRTVSTITDGQK